MAPDIKEVLTVSLMSQGFLKLLYLGSKFIWKHIII